MKATRARGSAYIDGYPCAFASVQQEEMEVPLYRILHAPPSRARAAAMETRGHKAYNFVPLWESPARTRHAGG
ncbi:hypothetical protein HHA04nite_21150 [Halomonas halophila]|uniref:Uncharacterized protein n=1 Tax=Halomonas halophila TaxID=29573 RepID=A0ABQ0U539_9GAMM|nr:hypothetical protein HHA04nite_21150 [Halomonas halophila]